MGRDANDPTGWAEPPQGSLHGETLLAKVVLVANEDEVRFPGKHFDDMCDYRFAIDFDQWLGQCISNPAKTLSEA